MTDEYLSLRHTLPEWLTEALPEHRPFRFVRYSEATKKFYVENEHPSKSYDSLVELYDSYGRHEDFDIKFSPEAMSAAGEGPNDLFTVVGNRILLDNTDDDRLALLISSYFYAVESVLRWRKNPSDFRLSYEMLNSHPVFWTKETVEPSWYWSTGDHVQRFWHALSQEGMMMEAGGHIEPDYMRTYHDLRLDAYGSSFEDCIIKTAALVDKFFEDNGTPRENVEYEKSELEIELEKRISEARDEGLLE